jgi:serine O-acetyltransferase
MYFAFGCELVCLLAAIWFCLAVPLLILRARAMDHRGSWWGLYVLGLYTLLAPLNHHLRQRPGLRSKLARAVSLLYQLLTLGTGAEIPLSTKIGRGLFLPHTAGVVLAGLSKLGAHCVITPGVVLGTDGRGNAPTVGRNVYIGANAVIVGSVVVGDNATVGAGTVVTRDVPPFGLVLGNPGLVVKENYIRSYHFHVEEDGCE